MDSAVTSPAPIKKVIEQLLKFDLFEGTNGLYFTKILP
jgi:hypothetical protein